MEETQNIVQTTLKHMPKIQEVNKKGYAPFIVMPNAVGIESLEPYLITPRRINQKIHFSDVSGFIKYVNKFKGEGTALFPNMKAVSAVFDYHAPDKPSHCSHHAIFQMAQSPEWEKWEANQGQSMRQSDFANFLEGLVKTIKAPAAADLMQVVKGIRATVTNKLASIVGDDGASSQLEFKRDVDVKTTTDVAIPKQLEIVIQPYIGIETAYSLDVRLRVQVAHDNSHVTFSYEILNFKRAKLDAFESLVKTITDGTQLEAYNGGSI